MPSQESQAKQAQDMADRESFVRRNPHPDFGKVQASRPDWDEANSFHFTKTRDPNWRYGSGATSKSTAKHVEIDPNDPNRPPVANYKLLISGIVPRPIGFVSTCSSDASSTNLAPFSYFNVVNNDPPVFILGFNGGIERAKDTLDNLLKTGECTLNIISEHFIEAANACAIDLPYGQSEWSVSGLTPAETTFVKPKRVLESIFSIEAKLMNTQEFESRREKGKTTGTLAVVEGVKFWVREDALNEEKTLIDPAVLRPIARLGGISYARFTDGFEIPRPVMKQEMSNGRLNEEMVKPKVDGQ